MKKKYGILLIAAILAVSLLTAGYKKNYNRGFTVETVSDAEAEAYASGNNKVIDGRININAADEELLAMLDGIGTSIAGRIVDYRRENGLFECTEDIMRVYGIGEKKYNAVKDAICCETGNGELEFGE